MLTFGQTFGIALTAKAIARRETDRLIAAMPKVICSTEMQMPGTIPQGHYLHSNQGRAGYCPPEPPAAVQWVAPEVDPVAEVAKAELWLQIEQAIKDRDWLESYHCPAWQGPLENEWQNHWEQKRIMFDRAQKDLNDLYREMAK
jgi:hypothetical protein